MHYDGYALFPKFPRYFVADKPENSIYVLHCMHGIYVSCSHSYIFAPSLWLTSGTSMLACLPVSFLLVTEVPVDQQCWARWRKKKAALTPLVHNFWEVEKLRIMELAPHKIIC